MKLKQHPSRPRIKFFSYLKNKKGFSNLEITIGTLILILIICAITDFSKTSAADSSVSAIANYVAETLSEQGGLSATPPSGYNGSYTTPKDLINYVKQSMDSIGISEDRWALYLKTDTDASPRRITVASDFGTLPYKSNLTIILNYQNKLPLINQNIPGSLPDLNRQMVRKVVTTYFDRTSSNIEFD